MAGYYNGFIPTGCLVTKTRNTERRTANFEPENRMNAINSWDDIPLFDNEQSEAAYWAENRLEVRLMEQAVAASSESSESVAITLRMDPRMLSKLKRLARSRYLNYQSMMKQWLSERLEQELRERDRGTENRTSKYFS